MRAAFDHMKLPWDEDVAGALIEALCLPCREEAVAHMCRVMRKGVARKLMDLVYDGPASTPATRYFESAALRDATQLACSTTALDRFGEDAEAPPQQCGAVVVGAGLAGLHTARALQEEDSSLSVVVLERSAHLGGVWRHHANSTSRVNSSEPSYRLNDGTTRTNHTRTSEILVEAARLVQRSKLRVVTETSVQRVTKNDEMGPGSREHGEHSNRRSNYMVRSIHAVHGDCATHTGLVVICTNRRLGAPRVLAMAGAEAFHGRILRGLGGDTDGVLARDAHVVVLGMGAFAIENLRTMLERRAARVDILCRRRGTVCPHIVDWANFARPYDDATFRHDPEGDEVILAYWSKTYDLTGATKPECWREGLLKVDGHTISVSDLFFVAHHARKADVHMGKVSHLDGESVHVEGSGEALRADMIVQCIGFDTNSANSRIVGADTMRCPGLVDRDLWVIAEPHLEARALTAPFGSSYLSYVQFVVKLLCASRRDAAMEDLLWRQVPSLPVDALGSDSLMDGYLGLAKASPKVGDLLREHLRHVTEATNASMSPQEYTRWNCELWDEAHVTLQCTDCPLAYPFANLWREIGMQEDGQPSPPSAPSPQYPQCPQSLHSVMKSLTTVVVDDVNADVSLGDLGMDSISRMEWRNILESTLNIELPSTILFLAATPRALAEHLDANMFSNSTATDTSGDDRGGTTVTRESKVEAQASIGAAMQASIMQASIGAATQASTGQVCTGCDLVTLSAGTDATASTAVVVLPSTWGTVTYYTGLARQLDGHIWGIQHPYLRTGEAAADLCAQSVREQSWEYAVLARRVAAPTFHVVGGSFGASLAQETAARLERMGVPVASVVLVDPPPFGPGHFGHGPTTRFIAGEALRLARQIRGESVDRAEIARAIDACADDVEAVLLAASSGLELTNGAWDMYRRIRVYRQSIALWARQPLAPTRLAARVGVLLSTGRRAFFEPLHGADFVDAFEAYGQRVQVLGMCIGEHTEVIQNVCTGRDAQATTWVRTFLEQPT